ncbi:MAG: SGNH/GDSL hydrolase family protein [Alphaproteobacteria bacterium]|nr:MAG: SGNH/GDSL hydrolase family protein [Alphaproteobacteria bacterium]
MPEIYETPAELIRFEHQLVHSAEAIRQRQVKIVAIGSSSTRGVGASSSQRSYPSRLEIELSQRYPKVSITIENKGIGGEEAGDELARFQKDVIDEKPALVVWQVGTNAVWKQYDLLQVAAAIREGLKRLKDMSMDIVLMDLQYAPAVLQYPTEAERMVAFITEAAKEAGANVFRRFALMDYWNVIERIPFDQTINREPDGVQLHQNDWSYAGVATALAKAIAAAAGQWP